jgi:hypothetical protein
MLERNGNAVRGWVSTDGNSWSFVGGSAANYGTGTWYIYLFGSTAGSGATSLDPVSWCDWFRIGAGVYDPWPFVLPAIGQAGADVLIGEQDLAADATTVTFGNIPQTYKALRLEVTARTSHTTFASPQIRVGAGGVDSGANYEWGYAFAGNSTSDSIDSAATHVRPGQILGDDGPADWFDYFEATIERYAEPTSRAVFHTTTRHARLTSQFFVFAGGGLWNDTTDAIDTIELSLDSGDWLAGSILRLYGVQ